MELLTDAQRALFATGSSLTDYDVLKPIGKGKFSVVYKAQRNSDSVAVALKKIAIFDLMDARAREKTLKEVRLVQSVAHENIVQYLDAFLDGKELYIAFEWADAGDLKRQIRKANERQVRLDERTIWRYFGQLCAAILHLHRARIMHRDLKPANILLTTQGVIKVGDLGLGRHLSENTLEAHSKVGTPLYMSPEVLKGEGYDWKSDVWSLGCILYELAMLRSPFKSEGLNLYGLFQKINKGDYEPVPDCYSDHLRGMVTRMISLDATRRPTMEQVWEACQTRPSTATLTAHVRQPAAQAVQQLREQTPSAENGDRKRANASPTPAPSPAASRPSSQQSDGTPRSASSSRPASSEKAPSRQPVQEIPATDEDIARRHEEMAMELLYDRLKLLPRDGEGEALLKRLTRHYFASESRSVPAWTQSPHERFNELCRFSTWMLSLVGETLDHDQQRRQDDAQAPVTRAQLLLLAAERAGVSGVEISQLSAASLTRGCGLDVVLFLTTLSEVALRATSTRRQRPVYPREAIVIMESDEQWEVQSDDHGVGTSGDSTTTSTPLQDDGSDDECGGIDARWLIVREPERRVRNTREEEAVAMIHSRVDTFAWRREVERVQPKLLERWCDRNTAQQGSSWHPRFDMLRKLSETIATARQPTCETLYESSKTRQREAETTRQLEARLHSQYDTHHTHVGAIAERLHRAQQSSQRLSDAVDERSRALGVLETEAQARISQLKQANARVADTTPLVRIKTQLQRLLQEIHTLGVQTELVRDQSWKKTARRF